MRILYLLLTASLFLSSGCDDTGNFGDDPIPYVIVDETINLNNLQYLPLKTIGGYVIHQAGVRGIILYRESSSVYRAYEQNCTYQPLESCAKVEIDDSGLFLIDPCCSSKFSFQGNPFEGPAIRPLLEYKTYVDGNFLLITN